MATQSDLTRNGWFVVTKKGLAFKLFQPEVRCQWLHRQLLRLPQTAGLYGLKRLTNDGPGGGNCGMFVVKSMANRARLYENLTSLVVRLQ